MSSWTHFLTQRRQEQHSVSNLFSLIPQKTLSWAGRVAGMSGRLLCRGATPYKLLLVFKISFCGLNYFLLVLFCSGLFCQTDGQVSSNAVYSSIGEVI